MCISSCENLFAVSLTWLIIFYELKIVELPDWLQLQPETFCQLHPSHLVHRCVLTCRSACCRSRCGSCPRWMTEARCWSCSFSCCRWFRQQWWPSLLSHEFVSCSATALCPPSLSSYTPLCPAIMWDTFIIQDKLRIYYEFLNSPLWWSPLEKCKSMNHIHMTNTWSKNRIDIYYRELQS